MKDEKTLLIKSPMKTVMILGGTKGVGNEILKSCLKKGYNVSFCERNLDEGNKLSNLCD